MFVFFIGCLMVNDPSVSPDIEDFNMDVGTLDSTVDELGGQDDENEPQVNEGTLVVTVENNILSVTHSNVLLPCNADLDPVTEVEAFVLTVTYTNQEIQDCERVCLHRDLRFL